MPTNFITCVSRSTIVVTGNTRFSTDSMMWSPTTVSTRCVIAYVFVSSSSFTHST